MIKDYIVCFNILILALMLFISKAKAQLQYTGSIGSYPIQLFADLQAGNGVYVYKKINTPISLSITLKEGALKLIERDGTGKKEVASFVFEHFDAHASSIVGIWKNLSSGKPLPIHLKLDYDFKEDGQDQNWKDKEVLQAVSLKDQYFKTVLSKPKGEHYASVNQVKIIDKKTNVVKQEFKVDCQEMGMSSISLGDFNFDGFTDFAVFETSYAGPNTSSLYYLYNPKSESFEASEIRGISLEFDPELKRIIETNQSSAGRERRVTIYKVVKNKMVVVEDHDYIWDEKIQDYVEAKSKK
ncbi:MAG: FG-GAP repeat protein [Candidatus Pedobacter colombiensis]|uniref:FG-GAP repeat protein n=1 Tax=Candidatus Pedobacter colombiensis TaxID=3121371 RepID=A0AAJ6B8X4_9SPHI|nr:FG-GAP repeat protein [Pedobacter sp.]WEK20941.1 MAG: FG-GAP repeat protein [Pedobacter sp.]